MAPQAVMAVGHYGYVLEYEGQTGQVANLVPGPFPYLRFGEPAKGVLPNLRGRHCNHLRASILGSLFAAIRPLWVR